MTSLILIGIGSLVLSLGGLWLLGKARTWRVNLEERPAAVDVAAALRALLLDKAEGRIDEAEFQRRQMLLHAQVLENPGRPAVPAFAWQPQHTKFVLAGLVLLALVLGGTFFLRGKGDRQLPLEMPSGMGGAASSAQAGSGGDLNTVVKRLADKMEADPGNGEGWHLLAKTYGELRRYAEADAAYAKAAPLITPDAVFLADWADAHVMANDRKWDDAGRKIVKRALAADANHLKALALAGSEAYDRGDFAGAIEFWKRMKKAAPADSMDAKLADANIEEAKARQQGKAPASAVAAPESAVLAGVVTLSPRLKGKVGPQDTVFVVAKAADGKGAPVAVAKHQGNDFPIEFRLDDSSAMLPGHNLSGQSEVVLSAKVSRSGSADPGSAFIESAPLKVKPGKTTLSIELSKER
jgi:cytochrome c-type biogenesis protein CcmH